MRKILVATDGSAGADRAIELVANLPLPRKTEIDVVSVVETSPPFLGEAHVDPADREAYGSITRELEAEAEEATRRATDRLKAAGWTPHSYLRWGAPAQEILDAVATSGADHVVVGATGHEDDNSARLGRTARRVLKHATVGVLLARPLESHDGRFRVMVPYDGSPACDAAVSITRRLSSERTHVTLVTVLTVATTLYRHDIIERMSASWQAHRAEVERSLDRIAEQLRPTGTTVEIRVLDGGTDPADEIVDATRLLLPDLTVVGRSGKGALRRLVLGSVSEALAEVAPSSVWVAGEVSAE